MNKLKDMVTVMNDELERKGIKINTSKVFEKVENVILLGQRYNGR